MADSGGTTKYSSTDPVAVPVTAPLKVLIDWVLEINLPHLTLCLLAFDNLWS